MIEIILGLLGAVLGAGLFIAGYRLGEKSGKMPEMKLSDAEKVKADEARALFEADQKAFVDLMNYNADTAYGVRAAPWER